MLTFIIVRLLTVVNQSSLRMEMENESTTGTKQITTKGHQWVFIKTSAKSAPKVGNQLNPKLNCALEMDITLNF